MFKVSVNMYGLPDGFREINAQSITSAENGFYQIIDQDGLPFWFNPADCFIVISRDRE